jgi:tetratricopeptide (TPR) repeat protein
MGCFRRACGILPGLMLLGLIYPSLARAAEGCEQWAARLVSVQGRVQLRRFGEVAWSPSRPDSRLCPGDRLRTGENSRAAILLPNETLVRLDQLTSVLLPEPKAQEQSLLLDVVRGIGYFFSRTGRKIEIKAPFVNAAVEGTELLVSAAPSESSVLVLDGIVRASNAAGSLGLVSGEGVIARSSEAPRKVLVADPRDAVKWALYYPPVIDFSTDGPDIPAGARDAVDAFYQGDIAGALSALDQVPKGARTTGFYGLRASILLYVGRVEESQADITRALKLDPGYAGAHALQSIIALVGNDSEAAMRFAEKGAKAEGEQGAASQIALSYVYQSRFDLDQARLHARSATQLAPNNPLAWARLAEIDLALRQLDAARRAAETATSLNPRISRTQTTLGFAQLLYFQSEKAADSFRRAIALDQGDPLPRLGLGISKIHRGELEDGRRDLEIAASIDPTTSIFRSYLGKAYYEEKRDSPAGTEYRIAEELDHKDPTPWFYDAIRKQTENQPVEALADLERSIELNNNREVYRSKLLLDSDLAARSASQARIYRDLGFQDPALVEGWRSVNSQPANFSAHRFLADAYLGQPGFEVARASEFLQSQLWQPLNLNPIQPQLTLSNLGIIQSAGPTLAGLNEYNPLFLSDGTQVQGNLIAGNNETFGDDLALSFVKGIFSLGIGQFHFETDGFRPNADQDQNLYNLFLQASPSPRASVQLEYRRYELNMGDTVLRFDPDDFSTGLHLQRTLDTLRFGARYEFSPRSKAIASVIGEGYLFDKRDKGEHPFAFTLEQETEGRSLTAEVQHLYQGNSFNLITGLSYFHLEPERTGRYTYLLPPPLPPFVISLDDDQDFESYKGYLYANLTVKQTVALHVGASYDECMSPVLDRSEFLPKLGLSWNVTPATKVRAATFQTMRCLGTSPVEPATALPQLESQTVEPTQIAGFNQLFDDPNGVTSDVYGVALDSELSSRLFVGGSLLRRDINFPYRVVPQGGSLAQTTTDEDKWREDNARAYLNLALDENWVFALAYQYELQDYTARTAVTGTSQLKTHRVPISLRFFAESGLSAGVTANYLNQQIQLGPNSAGSRISKSDRESFWLVDAAFVYRLPKRYGFVRLEMKNLFNREFRFQEPDPSAPTLYPDRLLLAGISLYLD